MISSSSSRLRETKGGVARRLSRCLSFFATKMAKMSKMIAPMIAPQTMPMITPALKCLGDGDGDGNGDGEAFPVVVVVAVVVVVVVDAAVIVAIVSAPCNEFAFYVCFIFIILYERVSEQASERMSE